ncbi:FlgD immunoglobulin-like domain containing protein [soil metagenome]
MSDLKKIFISFLVCICFVNISYSQSVIGKYSVDPNLLKGLNAFTKDIFKAPIQVTPKTSKFIISNFITDILKSGDTTWFATGKGLMRTIDHFNSFQYYRGLEPFGDDDISGLAIYKNLIVVSTATTQKISGDDVPVGTGIKVSTDYGSSWSSYPQPIDSRADTVITYGSNTIHALAVVVPQQNLSYDINITKNRNDTTTFTIWIASYAAGIRKSTDYGNTWQRVVLPPDNLDSVSINGTGYNFTLDPRGNLNHRGFAVSSLNDSVIFCGTANGINRSSDFGLSWRKYTYQNSGTGTSRVAGNFVVNFKVQKYNNKNIFWAATRRAEDNNEKNALTYSSDGGYTWAYTLNDLSPNGISFKDSITYGLTDGGVWRSKFGIFDWSKPSLIYDEQTRDQLSTTKFYSGNSYGDTLYFGTADGMVRTIENGQPWTSKFKIFRAVAPIDLSSDKKTYAAPNPFSPDDEVVRIFYKTGKPSSTITIKIFDFGMNHVRTLIQNASRTSSDELFTQWDGKNNNGAQVANGVYFYRIEIDSDKPVWGKILVLQ